MVNCSANNVLVGPVEAQIMEPYPDISGIGVVIGFMGTAYIAAILQMLSYCLAHDPLKTPFTSRTGDRPCASVLERNSEGSWGSNPVDVWFLFAFRRLFRVNGKWPWAAEVFDDCILAMCDIQLMTGFGILISGFAMLSSSPSRSPLSAFHWSVVAMLAWFSCVTHLSGLTTLRHTFSRYRWMKLSRAALMFTLLLMVTVAMVPTGYFNWNSLVNEQSAAIPSSPAACYFNITKANQLWEERCNFATLTVDGQAVSTLYGCTTGNLNETRLPNRENEQGLEKGSSKDSTSMQYMIFTVLLLVWAFVTRCFKMFEPLSRVIRRRLRAPLSRWARNGFDMITPSSSKLFDQTGGMKATEMSWKLIREETWMDLVAIPLFSIFLFLRIHADIFCSMLSEMLWVVITLTWGTVKLYDTLNSPAVPSHVISSEELWTFGQVMAVTLIVSPIFTMVWKFTVGRIQCESITQAADKVVHRSTKGTKILVEIRPKLVSDGNRRDRIDWDRDYYQTSSWISPFFASCFIAFVAVMFLMFYFTTYTNIAPTATLTQCWSSFLSIFVYILIGYPSACVATITAGVQADNRAQENPLCKWCFLLTIGIACQLLQVLGSCGYSLGITLRNQTGEGSQVKEAVIVATILYGLYVITYVARLAWFLSPIAQLFWRHR